jgi:hypothetical protein
MFTLGWQRTRSQKGSPMSHNSERKQKTLPSRFPVGTKLVVEGRRAGEGQVQVFKRYIEFPDGTLVRLPLRPEKNRTSSLRRTRKTAAESRVSH